MPSKLFEIATSIPYQFAGLMMPALTAGARSGGLEFGSALRNAVDVSAVYGVGAVLALAFFAPQILTLMAGAEFAAGAPALVFISVAIALAGATHILRFALVACEKPRFVLVGDSVACACAFAAYFALIPAYSFVGAAIGTVVTEVAALICMLVGLKRAGRAATVLHESGEGSSLRRRGGSGDGDAGPPGDALAVDAGDRRPGLPGRPRDYPRHSTRAAPQCASPPPSCVSRNA